ASMFANPDDAILVLESMARLSHSKVEKIKNAAFTSDAARREALANLLKCSYVKSADLADRFRTPGDLDPDKDPDIVGPTGIFSQAEYNSDAEFRKTAAVMKMVIEGYAGAGTITMGGYDYHGQGRATGEIRNLPAGRC